VGLSKKELDYMDVEVSDSDIAEALEIALACDALFEQYDELDIVQEANGDCYENLYPNIT